MSQIDLKMEADKNNIKTRRQWFTAGLRWGVGGLMAAAVGFLARRRQIGTETACVDPKGRAGCGGCDVLNGCSLPRALSYKRFQEQNGKTNT